MGYFSELDLTNRENNIDRSYHGFDEQLLWRYDDLKERRSLLSQSGAAIYGDDCFSKSEYLYASAECFNTLSDVCRAIEITRNELEEKYGIIIDDDQAAENLAKEDEVPNQISLFEIVLLPTRFQTAVAA